MVIMHVDCLDSICQQLGEVRCRHFCIQADCVQVLQAEDTVATASPPAGALDGDTSSASDSAHPAGLGPVTQAQPHPIPGKVGPTPANRLGSSTQALCLSICSSIPYISVISQQAPIVVSFLLAAGSLPAVCPLVHPSISLRPFFLLC